jgi:tetratricopeptide (TPR) repeat protein
MNFRVSVSLLLLAISALPGMAGRYKLNIDPETKEGFVLQQIKQERNAAKKIEMMMQFVDEYPKDENLPWVLDQLLPVYSESKNWEKVLSVGDKLLAVNPSDHEVAFAMMRAAEAINTTETLKKYASKAWHTADLVTESPKPKDPAEVPAWQKNAEQARNLKLYAEYAVYALSKGNSAQKEEHLRALEELNPRSIYLIAARQAEQKSSMTIPAVLEGLQKEPFNVDYLAIVCDHYMKQNDLPKVAAMTGRLIDALANRKPDNMSLKEWGAKRDLYSGRAYWMNGVVSSVLGNHHQADRSLRAALPFIRGNASMLSAGLYHLGFANYKLAQAGEPNRVFEAIKFNLECSKIPGSYQEQAGKNVVAIKAEYSIP